MERERKVVLGRGYLSDQNLHEIGYHKILYRLKCEPYTFCALTMKIHEKNMNFPSSRVNFSFFVSMVLYPSHCACVIATIRTCEGAYLDVEDTKVSRPPSRGGGWYHDQTSGCL